MNSPLLDLPAPRQRPVDAPYPLKGIRVLDFSHFIAGPYCSMMLADFGAEVIKVESIDGGDSFRHYPPHVNGEGIPYIWANRNKKSITLDLKSDSGRKIALELIATSDVVVENFSTGVMRRLGLDYESLPNKEKIIYCSVSAYGRTGPYAHHTGFDPVVQAESGFMSMIGLADKEPMRAGPSIVDLVTALMACNGVMAAIAARFQTGKGQLVEISMIGAGINMLANFASAYLATGENPTRFGNVQPTSSPVGLFETADEPIYLACATDRTFQRLMSDVLGKPDMAADPRYKSNELRRQNRESLFEIIAGELQKRPREEWLTLMHDAGVPAGAIRTVAQAVLAPEVAMLGLVSAIPRSESETVPNIGLPISLSETPLADPVCAPALGGQTDEILKSILGFSDAQLTKLRREGVIGSAGAGGK